MNAFVEYVVLIVSRKKKFHTIQKYDQVNTVHVHMPNCFLYVRRFHFI